MIHLKKPQAVPKSVNQEIRDTVSKVLLEVERDGMAPCASTASNLTVGTRRVFT